MDTKDIFTPYYREIFDIPGPIGYRNYTSYDLFCLKKNMSPYIEGSFNLESRQDGDRMYITIQLYNGYEIIPTEEVPVEEKKRIKKIMKKSIYETPGCLLYDFEVINKKYKGQYHKKWALSLMKDIYRNKDEYSFSEDNKLYISGLEKKHNNHELEWNTKNLKIESFLSMAYEKGIIYLSSRILEKKKLSEDFLKDWNLVPYERGTKLFYPRWNTNIISDKVSFLYERVTGIDAFVYFNRYNMQWIKINIHNYDELIKETSFSVSFIV
jgi:hypothetical protein